MVIINKGDNFMKKVKLTKILLLSLILVVSVSDIGCGRKDKQKVISNNVSIGSKQEEDEIQRDIELGNNYLLQGKYDNAKQSYEKAIYLNIGNKQTYLTIKDKYLEKGRIDDAYYIIKLAMQNNVDTANMSTILYQISGRFEIVNIQASIAQNQKYTLPEEATIKINGVDTKAAIKWNNPSIDTSKVGNLTCEGNCEQYGRKVKLILNIELSQQEAQKILINKLKPGENIRFDYIKDFQDGENYYAFQKVFILGDGTEDGGDIGSIFFVEKNTGDIYVYDLINSKTAPYKKKKY